MSRLMDFPAQAGRVGVVYWQEEVYRKIQSMKEMYLPELNELYQKVARKCQQHDALVLQPKQSNPIEKLKLFKGMLERMITFLQVPKSNISHSYKDKLAQYEKQIVGVLHLNRQKKLAWHKKLASQQPGQNGVGPLQQS